MLMGKKIGLNCCRDVSSLFEAMRFEQTDQKLVEQTRNVLTSDAQKNIDDKFNQTLQKIPQQTESLLNKQNAMGDIVSFMIEED
jgi:hypothetical protein